MNAIVNIILAVQMLTALGMIGLILIQHGKGADMGAAFGSGSAGSLFGASGSATFLSHATAVLAFVFFSSTLVLAYYGNLGNASGSSSVLSNLPAAPATVAASAAAPASAPASRDTASMIPGNAPAASAPKVAASK